MKTKSRNLIVVFLMALAMLLACIPVATLTANAELNSLENVSVNNGVVTWDAFPGAAEYSYSYGNGGGYLDEPSLDLELQAKSFHWETGEYDYSIYAVDEYGTQISGEITGTYSYTCTQTPLETPTNLTWDHTTANWDAVEGAEYYVLCIYEYKNSSYSLITAQGRQVFDGTSYDMGTIFEVGKTYCFDVKACAAYEDLDHLDSEYARSENKTFEGVVPSLTNVEVENGKLTFDAVTGASKYDISIGNGGASCYELPINMYEICSSISLDDGVYDIRIRVYNEYNEPLAPEYTYEDWEYDSALAPAKLTGTLTVTGTLKVGETLTATLTDSNNTGTLTYTWFRSDPYADWVAVQTGDSNTFVLTEACANKRMCVIVESDVEHSQVESANTGIVAEANNAENLTGTVNILGTEKYGGTLTADVSSNNTGTLYYQWKRSGVDIPGATSISYAITVDDIGQILRVVVTSSVEVGSIASDATAVIEKANGASAPTGITATGCTNKANNDGTISGVTTAMEYKLGDGSWNNVTSTTINNLASGTYYIRIKETDTHKASATASVVVNAYVALTYDVTFDANGGAGEMNSVPVEENDNYTLPSCTFTAPVNYEFKCWSVNEVEKAVGSQITITADTTITAVWQLSKIKNVEITGMPEFVVGGDIVTNASVLSVPANANYEITGFAWYDLTADDWADGQFVAGHTYQFSVNVVAKEDFEFGGQGEIVATIDGNPAEVYKNGAQILVKYIVGEPIVYTITFDANGGSGTMEPVEVGGNYVLPECEFTPPEGKTFDKWTVSGAGAKEPGNAVVVGEDLTVTAMWKELPTPQSLTATYTGEILAGTTINPSGISITLTYSDSSTEPVNAGIVEYWYNGSQIQDPINYVFGVELIGNLNITVKYQGFETTMAVQVVGYEITFNANTGSGTMESVEYVGAYTLPTCTFTALDGKQFKGWAISANGEVIDGTTYNVTADVELFAIWENIPVITYDVTFNANGGEGTMQGVEFAGTYTLPTCTFTAPDGKQFKGWATSANGEVIDGATYNVTADVEFFAIWENIPVITYDVTFNANGGEGTMQGVEFAGTYTLPNCTFTAPDGKQFKGWATSANGEVIDGTTYNVTADVELFAIWENIPHEHNYGTTWQSDANNHWKECACEDKANIGAHVDENTDGQCDVCAYQISTGGGSGSGEGENNAGSNTGNNNQGGETGNNNQGGETSSGQVIEEEQGLSAGAIAGIVVGSTVGAIAIGVGIFLIIWIFVKKKTIAELLATLKKK